MRQIPSQKKIHVLLPEKKAISKENSELFTNATVHIPYLPAYSARLSRFF